MSYIKNKGELAAQDAMKEKVDFSKALVKFKSGTTYTVRFASAFDYVNYDAVSIYGKITTTPIIEGNLYEKAVKFLYEDARNETNEKVSEELKELAGQLRPRERYLIAFVDLATGQPSVIDVTKKQAQGIIQGIKKYENKLSKLPFELSKSGSGQSTTVAISPVIDIDDLSKDEKKHWKETDGYEISEEIFNVLYMRNKEEQIEDLKKIDFDVSRLGIEETQTKQEDYDF